MLGISFIVASILFSREIKRKKFSENIAVNVTFIALVGGIIGAKLLYVIEEGNFEGLFSPAGLTWYGGLILATVLIYVYVRIKKVPFLAVCDAAAPSLALGYGIARIGCHLSGDGDYGVPVSEFASWVPWGTDYSKGTLPPSVAFRGTEIAEKFGGVVPNDTPCHPTPIYELILAIIIFAILWRRRERITESGKLFFLYLILSGISRFLVEFIRLNPRILFDLTEAQIISLLMIAGGLILYYKFPYRKPLGAS
jgi:phosphatidylglycerol:prolipoprotein diacylglycerol transferase